MFDLGAQVEIRENFRVAGLSFVCYTTVDGSFEIRRSPVDMVDIPLFTTGFIHARWLFGISEPSTVFTMVDIAGRI